MEAKHKTPSETDLKVSALVRDNLDLLKGMASHTELRKWALANDLDNAPGFAAFKKSLNEFGIDYEGIRNKTFNSKQNEIKQNADHGIVLIADADHGHGRFAISSPKQLLWYGKFHENDNIGSKEDCFIQVAMKAIWFASKVKTIGALNYMKLQLIVTSKDLLNIKDVKSRAASLNTSAQRYNILLSVTYKPSAELITHPILSGKDWKNWQEANLDSVYDDAEG